METHIRERSRMLGRRECPNRTSLLGWSVGRGQHGRVGLGLALQMCTQKRLLPRITVGFRDRVHAAIMFKEAQAVLLSLCLTAQEEAGDGSDR